MIVKDVSKRQASRVQGLGLKKGDTVLGLNTGDPILIFKSRIHAIEGVRLTDGAWVQLDPKEWYQLIDCTLEYSTR